MSGYGNASAGQVQSHLRYPPGGMPTMASNNKDFHGDLGQYPGRGPTGSSAGWQQMCQKGNEAQMAQAMQNMKQHQNMDQSQRALETARQRYYAAQQQQQQQQQQQMVKQQAADDSESDNSGAMGKYGNIVILVVVGLIGILLVDAFLKMKKRPAQ